MIEHNLREYTCNIVLLMSTLECWSYHKHQKSKHSNKDEWKTHYICCFRWTACAFPCTSSWKSNLAICAENALISRCTWSHRIILWRDHPKTSRLIGTLNKVRCCIILSPVTWFWANTGSSITSCFISRTTLTSAWWCHNDQRITSACRTCHTLTRWSELLSNNTVS